MRHRYLDRSISAARCVHAVRDQVESDPVTRHERQLRSDRTIEHESADHVICMAAIVADVDTAPDLVIPRKPGAAH
jgi:hypothetical protein